jgi:cytochrome c-type biogenesis protein CcmH/NrfF
LLLISRGVNAELIGSFVEQYGRVTLTHPETSKMGIFIFAAGALLILVAGVKIAVGRNVLGLLKQPKLWAMISMVSGPGGC